MEEQYQYNDSENQPIAPDPNLHFPVYRKGGSLYFQEGATLPLDVCIKTGRPVWKVVTKGVRNPYNPLSWFGGQPNIQIGLSKGAQENFLVAKAATFSLLIVGAVILIMGVTTLSMGLIAFGLLAVLCCGVFRASTPVWSPDAKSEPIELRGTSEKFRALFPEGISED